MTKQKRDLILMLVIGVLIGTSLVMVWSSRWRRGGGESNASTPSEVSTGGALPSATTPPATISLSALSVLPPSIPENTRIGLSVLDQPAGKIVSISTVSIEGTKWIAIYDDHDGKPGWILGAARVHQAENMANVELLRPEGMISGETYYAAILNDDGDGEFNRLTDLPPLSPDKVTIVRFSAQ